MSKVFTNCEQLSWLYIKNPSHLQSSEPRAASPEAATNNYVDVTDLTPSHKMPSDLSHPNLSKATTAKRTNPAETAKSTR